jgi:transcriptional regulator with XRE-family HTH domain
MTRRPSDVVAERVRRYRKRLGWSVRELAEECARFGAPELTEASLGNIERGPSGKRKRRDVTVDEIMVLGYALGVPPLLLLVPLGENETVQLVPPYELHPHLAWDVVTGASPLVEHGNFAIKLAEGSESRLTVQAFARLRETQEAYQRARAMYKGLDESASEMRRVFAQERWTQSLAEYGEAVSHLIDRGLDVPPLTKETIDDLRTSGVVTVPEKLIEFVPPPEWVEAWESWERKGRVIRELREGE